LATQIPHAVGAALALRSDSADARVAVTYFGDGAASEGDFYCALNFAAALEAPALFLCRNNGWAISTPAAEQYAGDGVAARACALGVDALRVDGNDALAVRAGVAEMRKRVVLNQRPAFVELMTYRLSHHSTSDDATQYRRADEQRQALKNNPVDRLGKWLQAEGWWDADQEARLRGSARAETLQALVDAEKVPKTPPLESLFDDVYDKRTPNLDAQRAVLSDHLRRQAP